MSKEKQTKEMACAMCGNNKICVGEGVEKCILYPTMWRYANNAYREGYRKQIDAEWIFKEYGEDTYTNLTRIYECSLCGRTIECLNEADEPYCHCGAKMKGV